MEIDEASLALTKPADIYHPRSINTHSVHLKGFIYASDGALESLSAFKPEHQDPVSRSASSERVAEFISHTNAERVQSGRRGRVKHGYGLIPKAITRPSAKPIHWPRY
jgi:hypothetical protein